MYREREGVWNIGLIGFYQQGVDNVQAAACTAGSKGLKA